MTWLADVEVLTSSHFDGHNGNPDLQHDTQPNLHGSVAKSLCHMLIAARIAIIFASVVKDFQQPIQLKLKAGARCNALLSNVQHVPWGRQAQAAA